MTPEDRERFRTNRLSGEPLPPDLELLLVHDDDLRRRVGVEMPCHEGWTPWLDTSYLSESERGDPDIAANLRAIEGVCQLISFVAVTDEREYVGYWRGRQRRRVVDSTLVVLDNEGQFRITAGRTLAEALLELTGPFEELRDWFRSLGIAVSWETDEDMTWPDEKDDPAALHEQLYYGYLAEGAAGGPTRS